MVVNGTQIRRGNCLIAAWAAAGCAADLEEGADDAPRGSAAWANERGLEKARTWRDDIRLIALD